jgi:hypothetical protein
MSEMLVLDLSGRSSEEGTKTVRQSFLGRKPRERSDLCLRTTGSSCFLNSSVGIWYVSIQNKLTNRTK